MNLELWGKRLTVEERLLLLEEENRSLKNRMMKAENNAETGIALGIVGTISLPILTLFVIMMAVYNGLLKTDFVMNALILSAIFMAGFILPFLTLKIALVKIKQNK